MNNPLDIQSTRINLLFIQKGNEIVPIEVKSGSQGKMQSMRIFLKEHDAKKGIRISLENFSRYGGLEIYPLYAIANIFK